MNQVYISQEITDRSNLLQNKETSSSPLIRKCAVTMAEDSEKYLHRKKIRKEIQMSMYNADLDKNRSSQSSAFVEIDKKKHMRASTTLNFYENQ